MMVKYFCDQCGKEYDGRPDRVRRTWGKLTVEVMRAVNGTWNDGHACRECILRAVAEGGDIP